MPREHLDYRTSLEILNTRYPGHDMLSVNNALLVTGCKKRDTVMKHLGGSFVNNRISKAALARYMCG